MPYRCLDCGNSSSTRFPRGACPACDSMNVRAQASSFEFKKEKSKSKKMFAFLLWTAMIYAFWYEFIR